MPFFSKAVNQIYKSCQNIYKWPMDLICMAHLGEAQAFIKQLKLKLINNEIYQNEDTYLLITGEGPFEVLSSLPYIIGKYDITRILNFGIAGSLNQKITVDTMVEIRTLYGYGETKPRFHSYLAESEKTQLDCITTEERVLTDEFAKELSNFADIVDREAWSIGKVAQKYKIPFTCHKLISDMAGTQTQCFDLKQKALEFSEKMLNHYLTMKYDDNSTENLNFNFKCSFTHEKKLENLIQKLNLTKIDINNLYTDIHEENPKLLARQIINLIIKKLEADVNPINATINHEFSKLSTPFTHIGAHLYFSPNKDQKQFSLKMDINSQTNINNLIKQLESFEFSKFEKIWNGDFHV